jgi:hypothetical protein
LYSQRRSDEVIYVHGHDRRQESSVAFPFLDLRMIEHFFVSFDYGNETAWIRSFRDWVREQYGHLSR